MLLAAAFFIIVLTMWLLVREVDVRLVLFGAGLALTLLVGKPLAVFDVFLAEMGNGKTIGPICTAMGYAYVLRATGCDRAMVRLLLSPVKRVRWLLIPGGCAVGFVTNIAITSQTAVAAAVGPILVPLMLAAGYSPVVAAATLLLGCSGGGSLYNPGDADLVAIQASSQAPMKLALDAMFLPLLGGFLTAVAVFTFVENRRSAGASSAADAPDEIAQPWWKALLPPLPVIAIFLMMPGVFFSALPAPFEKGMPVSHAMIAATMVVLLLCRSEASHLAKKFCEGLGYAYANIITLIVTAACFIEGLTAVGLTEKFVKLVAGVGWTAKLAAGAITGGLAIIAGTGIGPSVAFSKAVLPSLSHTNLAGALDLGALAAIAATFGRTMSPVAAVVIFCATFAPARTIALIKHTAPPLLAGFVVMLAIVIARG